MAKLYIVGIGPGDLKNMTYEAREALESADVVVGYKTYLDFITPLLAGKELVSSGMTKEVERCSKALDLATGGKNVVLVSSGDAGVYGMAGLVLELANDSSAAPEIVIVPGVSAVHAAAAVLGAPLMNDFAVISLSDLLTPWHQIERRLEAAAGADFVVALYNPKSKGRVTQIERAREIFLASLPGATPVGIVRNACREGEEKTVTTLEAMLAHPIDMFSIVIIGNSSTFVDEEGRMVTPRGYGVGGTDKQAVPSTAALSEPRSVMFCGTASDVGKSIITAGFCRILKKRGLRVAPFKSQNMALNSAVTPEGGEIGRAQSVQADACGIPPHTDMNPVLLKPNSETGSQVIVQGKVVGAMSVAEYNLYKPQVFQKVAESFARLKAGFEFVVIEGAGSIAEINLKAHDIANLKVADMADCPAILIADIDRGGVFAQVIGTMELLTPAERRRIKGVIINKFRGDPSLLEPGIDFIEQRTGVPVLGVVPMFSGFCIPEEDSVALEKKGARDQGSAASVNKLHIGVLKLPRISNYTDFDPLEAEPDVVLHYIENVKQLHGMDLLILPGSKSTTADLFFMMERGLYDRVRQFPGPIVGICGGFQMLGKRVLDPHAIESDIREAQGLALLDVETTLLEVKETHQAMARLLPRGRQLAPACSDNLHGYEIHMGETTLIGELQPFAMIVERSGSAVEISDGAVSSDGRIFGTYLHGLFDNDGFRTAFLNRIRRDKGMKEHKKVVPLKDPLDLLATHLEQHLDMERLLKICGLPL
jgi:adenosylcobyric acid synthase